ncbi:MAG: NAD(P)/FAD-dependent oxidoreductase [Solirubrobacteraceae bacterium]|nr:NAD(P)/FAD-dependent oxidoreductase [Patulibacter sp.]
MTAPLDSSAIAPSPGTAGSDDASKPTLVLGGGPAGLTAGYQLVKANRSVRVFEGEDQVGGIAMTVERDGYRFDLGGHRFFTKNQEVDDLWHEIMGGEFLKRPRQSRIYWNKKFLEYPLEGTDVIKKLGPVELFRAGMSYLKAAIFNKKGNEKSLEEWVINRFGKRLYQLFFKSYTEKVWGVPCDELGADWAAQRIKDLSFISAAKAAFFGDGSGKHKSLIKEFNYPRFGPGQMWEQMTDRINEQGGTVELESMVTGITIEGNRVTHVEVNGEQQEAGHVISSLPLRNIVGLAGEAAPKEVVEAAQGLRYRDFLTVALVVDGADLFPDNWIYIHEPDVKVGRIQNFRSWSPWMVPDQSKASIGMEYFCFAGDEMWEMDDDDLVALATKELVQIGLIDKASRVDRGYAVRVPKAYPMYDEDYDKRVDVIKQWVNSIENLAQVGRNGLHRYNNSDHSMLSAMRAVDNFVLGHEHDIWEVNVESAYLEEGEVSVDNPYRNTPETQAMKQPLTK